MADGARQALDRAKTAARTERRETPVRCENRYVYGGEPPQGSSTTFRQTRKAARRRVSTFNTIVLLFGSGILIVLYVNNIITINSLAAEVGQLQVRCDSLRNTNASLRAEVNMKASWERIGKTAAEQLGLAFPTEQPQKIAVDRDALERARGQGRAGNGSGSPARRRGQ